MASHPNKYSNWFLFFLDIHNGFFQPYALSPPIWGKCFHAGFGKLDWGSEKNHKINEGRILADNEIVLSRLHSVKNIIPHLNVGPVFYPWSFFNLLIPIIVFFGSSNKCVFSSYSVVGKDGPIAVTVFWIIGVNQDCMESISLPGSLVFSPGTVHIHFTIGDFIAGIFVMAVDALIEYALSKIFEYSVKFAFDKLAGCKGFLKNQVLSLLRNLRLPKVLRENAAFFSKRFLFGVSTSEKIIDSIVMPIFQRVTGFNGLTDYLEGLLPGGSVGSTLADFYSMPQKINNWLDEASETINQNVDDIKDAIIEKTNYLNEKVNGLTSKIKNTYNDLKQAHYNRNQYQTDLPFFEEEVKNSPDWVLEGDSPTHNLGAESGNTSYRGTGINAGKQAVYDPYGHIVISPENQGTYDFGEPLNPDGSINIVGTVEHITKDVVPWVIWGNTPDDSTDVSDRVGSLVDVVSQKSQEEANEIITDIERGVENVYDFLFN